MTVHPVAGARRNLLIVEDDTLVAMGLRTQLERLGHTVVGQAAHAPDAIELYTRLSPDLVLLDICLDDVDGIELAEQLLAARPCPMIILSAFGERELIDRASAAGVFGYLIKPTSDETLQAAIQVAISRFDERQLILQEKQQLALTLETRKLTERAKGIFMKRLGLDEAEAHRRLQTESQKRRLSMADMARKVIESEDLLGG